MLGLKKADNGSQLANVALLAVTTARKVFLMSRCYTLHLVIVTYTSNNGVANGGVHPEAAGQGYATRPSSAASFHPSTKADAEMQVSIMRVTGVGKLVGQVVVVYR